MKRFLIFITLCLLIAMLPGLLPQTAVQAADEPVVYAVLFYSPSCGHCQKVITEDLPPLIEKYKDQLQIVGIDVTTQNGQILYQSTIETFQIDQDRLGVPTLVVGNAVMVGSDEIPAQFPALIDQGLASGGIPWPAIPGLADAIASEPPPNEGQIEHATQGGNLTVSERFALDPVANTIAVVVLVGMLISVILVGLNFSKIPASGPRFWPSWSFGLLLLIGIFAAGYLTYVEVTDTTAILWSDRQLQYRPAKPVCHAVRRAANWGSRAGGLPDDPYSLAGQPVRQTRHAENRRTGFVDPGLVLAPFSRFT